MSSFGLWTCYVTVCQSKKPPVCQSKLAAREISVSWHTWDKYLDTHGLKKDTTYNYGVIASSSKSIVPKYLRMSVRAFFAFGPEIIQERKG